MSGEFVFGVDLDGVCADYHLGFRDVVATELGVEPETLARPTEWGYEHWGVGADDFNRLHKLAVTEKRMLRNLPVMDGCPDALWRLSDLGVWIRIITHRLYVNWGHAVTVGDTVAWLDEHRIPYRDICFLGDKPQVGADAYIDSVLNEVGLSLAEIKGRYPNELSGGQAQRVAVARALITKPSLIIADEPVSMLDASLRMSIVNMFRKLKEDNGVSIVYITHDLATAYYSADRIAVMLRGWIVELGPVEKVLGEPLHPYTQNLKDSIPQADPDKVWGKTANLADMEADEYTREGCRFAGRCPAVMKICREQEPPDFEHDDRTVKCFLYGDEA